VVPVATVTVTAAAVPTATPSATASASPTWQSSPSASATTPAPTTPASSTPSPTAAPALTCTERSGYEVSVCASDTRIAATSIAEVQCATTAAQTRCGDAGTTGAVLGRRTAGQLLVRYFPAYVACLPTTSGTADRFDCLRLAGHGESAIRPDNAFLEVWADGTGVTGRTVPRTCTTGASFTCNGVTVALEGTEISVEYAASSATVCAGFEDPTISAVLVRCGYR